MKKNNENMSVPWKNNHIILQGQQEYKLTKRDKERKSAVTEVGIVYKVGVGFVELLQNDNTILKVLTDHISNIKVVDRDGRNKALDDLTLDCKRRYNQNPSSTHCKRSPDDCRYEQVTCIQDHVIPFCDERIQLRLAGLTNSINFKLFNRIGCKVILKLNGDF
ncbi:hypothetical protein [Bacillus sp. FJAT-45037]|uniref:hypothetical protein n=1 Tax=Bacillus sp. FJAT-45037 TaxID=2011007 RepID=UPI000C23C8D0|nr:hypothetical protein [Bacillus sp. FJAT-45037]